MVKVKKEKRSQLSNMQPRCIEKIWKRCFTQLWIRKIFSMATNPRDAKPLCGRQQYYILPDILKREKDGTI